MTLARVEVWRQSHVQAESPAQQNVAVRHELDLGGRALVLGGEDVEDDAGLAVVRGPVRARHRVAAADRVTRAHEHVQHVHAPRAAAAHHELVCGDQSEMSIAAVDQSQLTYGVAALLEGDDDADAVGELGAARGDDGGVEAVHDGAAQHGHAHPLGDHHRHRGPEHRADVVLQIQVFINVKYVSSNAHFHARNS